MKFGSYTVSAIETGTFGLDGGAMFGIVPKTIWNRTNPSDELNRIDMHLRAMLIQSKDRNILVDCGIGSKWADKYAEIYKIDHSKMSLDQSLKKKGLEPKDITDIIATHLHFDHVGGLTYREDPRDLKSSLLPKFPNAKIWIQKLNWELAWSPNEKDQASYLSENFGIYRDSTELKNKLEFIDTPTVVPDGRESYKGPSLKYQEIIPGIEVMISNGHTLGMQIVRIHDENQPIYYCADLIPTSSHVRTNFIMGYDCYPMFIMAEKRLFLEKVLKENGALFYEHCPYYAASTIKINEKGQTVADKKIEL